MATEVSSRLELSIPPKVSSPAVNYRIIIDSFFFSSSSSSQYFKLAFFSGPCQQSIYLRFQPHLPIIIPFIFSILAYASSPLLFWVWVGLPPKIIPLLLFLHRTEKKEPGSPGYDVIIHWKKEMKKSLLIFLLVRQKVVLRLFFSVIAHQLWWRQN